MDLVRNDSTDTPRAGSALALAAFIVTALLAGYVGSLLQGDALDTWYPTIEKPSFNPPNGVFFPVWTTLYVIIGVAAWLGWRQRDEAAGRRAVALFLVQLVLNAAWTGIFFGLESPGWALVEIIVLLATIIAWVITSWRAERLAALVLLPYAAWVTFATVLTASIVYLN